MMPLYGRGPDLFDLFIYFNGGGGVAYLHRTRLTNLSLWYPYMVVALIYLIYLFISTEEEEWRIYIELGSLICRYDALIWPWFIFPLKHLHSTNLSLWCPYMVVALIYLRAPRPPTYTALAWMSALRFQKWSQLWSSFVNVWIEAEFSLKRHKSWRQCRMKNNVQHSVGRKGKPWF